MIKRYKKILRKHLDDILAIKTTPHEIALGFAIGTAIAVLPTLGLGFLIGFLIMLVYKNISKISMLIAFAFWNPLILIPLTGLSYYIGDLILSDRPVVSFQIEFLNQLFLYTRRYLLGNIILTIVLTSLSYIGVYYFAKIYKKL